MPPFQRSPYLRHAFVLGEMFKNCPLATVAEVIKISPDGVVAVTAWTTGVCFRVRLAFIFGALGEALDCAHAVGCAGRL